MPAHRLEHLARHPKLAGALRPRFSPTAVFTGEQTPPAATSPTTGNGNFLTNFFPPTNNNPATNTPPNPLTGIPGLSGIPGLPGLSGFPFPGFPGAQQSSSSSLPITPSTLSSSQPTVSLPPSTSAPPSTSLPLATPSLPSVVGSAPAALNTLAASTTSQTPSPSGSSNAGKIVGIVGACVVGLACLIALIAFFLRRLRRRREDVIFDAGSFRRSGILLDDPHSPPSRGVADFAQFSSVTPQMTEAPSNYGTMYGASPASGYGYSHNPMAEYNMYGQPMQSPHSNASANPFLNPAPYYDSPFSPMASPTHPVMNSTQLVREPSASAGSTASSVEMPRAAHDTPGMHTSPQGDYLDLSRSSVTPFQAQQYAEISKTLNTSVPAGLPPVVDEDEEDTPPVPDKDNRQSTASDNSLRASQELNFPAPPPPSLTPATRLRVVSPPPVLPEIRVQQRDSSNSFNLQSYDFPASVRGSIGTPISSGYPSGVVSGIQTVVMNEKRSDTTFPVTPSPLASSFVIPGQTGFPTTPAPAAVQSSTNENKSKLSRPETLYDMDDAYGGI